MDDAAVKPGVVSLIYMKGTIESSNIYIKNMVCNRCIAAVTHLLEDEKIAYQSVSLGEVVLTGPLSAKQKTGISAKLSAAGFLLLDDSKSRTIEKIKNIIIKQVHHGEPDVKYNLSKLLPAAFNKDYSSISRLFSEVEGITIEKYAINQKIERIKELLVYDEMNLNEIAFQLGYSSVAHLSAQFKKVTGLTPSYFKNARSIARKTLDTV